jgi:signal peptidase II
MVGAGRRVNNALVLRAAYAVVSVAVLWLDHWSKQWAAARLRFGPDLDLIPGFLRFVYAENPGIAFSLFNSGEQTTRWLLACFSTTAACVVTVMAARTDARMWRAHLTYAMLFAGIVGNLVDRVRTGRVVDFIDVYVGTHHWPVFNVADSAITVGAVLLALELMKPAPHRGKSADVEP